MVLTVLVISSVAIGISSCSSTEVGSGDTGRASITTETADNGGSGDSDNDSLDEPDVATHKMGDVVRLGNVENGQYTTFVIEGVVGTTDGTKTGGSSEVTLDASASSTTDMQLTASLVCSNGADSSGEPLLSPTSGSDWPISDSGAALEMTSTTSPSSPLVITIPKGCVDPAFELQVSGIDGTLAGNFEGARWPLAIASD